MPRLGSLWARVLLIAAIGLPGCSVASPADDLGSSAMPERSTSAEPSTSALGACRPLELLTPEGDRFDLTGAWQGGVTFHEVRHFQDCVWWVGFSSWPGDELGDAWLLIFTGRLASDFTLTGYWSEIYTAELHAPRNCPVTFQMDFTEDGDIELVTEVSQEDPCSYYAATMTRVDGPPN